MYLHPKLLGEMRGRFRWLHGNLQLMPQRLQLLGDELRRLRRSRPALLHERNSMHRLVGLHEFIDDVPNDHGGHLDRLQILKSVQQHPLGERGQPVLPRVDDRPHAGMWHMHEYDHQQRL